MAETNQDIIALAEAYVVDFFKRNIGAEYVFHDIQHVRNVVGAVKLVGEGCGINGRQIELLQLAAWFHDTGYVEGAEGHEERSCKFAVDFLSRHNVPEQDLDVITRCIMATKLPFKPKDLLEEVMCDGDLSHLGKDIYWDRCGRLRQELLMTRSIMMSEQEWIQFEIDFMGNHHYFTEAAQDLYGKRKEKHIRQLVKQKQRLNPTKVDSVEALAELDKSKLPKKKKKKKNKRPKLKPGMSPSEVDVKSFDLGRGVETMYRTTYRTHINLSSIADNKANIMLSINAIVISISLPQLLPLLSDSAYLVVPTIMLLGVCIVAIVLATLSTRPKITEGKFTREDIEKRTANLLFFGNFYEMPFKDYHWGMMEMLKDQDFLYSSMTKDLYFLGVVLAKKYRYLSYCYSVFMYGLVLTVLAFIVAFVFFSP
ncbi:MAG: Pycsar system effector family protein [Bacteroidota bacterium]